MKYLLPIFLLFSSSPSQALTWEEFWKPFVESTHHHSRIRNKVETCYKHIRYEEYVAGNSYAHGYVRHHHEKHQIPCY